MKAMALNHTLETFTFCGSYHIYFFTFRKNVYGNSVAKVLFNCVVTKFLHEFLCAGICFGKMLVDGRVGVFFLFVAKCDLGSIVPVSWLSLNLGHSAGTRFDDGA